MHQKLKKPDVFHHQSSFCSDGSDEPYRNNAFEYDENVTFCKDSSADWYGPNRFGRSTFVQPDPIHNICILPSQLKTKKNMFCSNGKQIFC